jgi:hypothetical protein
MHTAFGTARKWTLRQLLVSLNHNDFAGIQKGHPKFRTQNSTIRSTSLTRPARGSQPVEQKRDQLPGETTAAPTHCGYSLNRATGNQVATKKPRGQRPPEQLGSHSLASVYTGASEPCASPSEANGVHNDSPIFYSYIDSRDRRCGSGVALQPELELLPQRRPGRHSGPGDRAPLPQSHIASGPTSWRLRARRRGILLRVLAQCGITSVPQFFPRRPQNRFSVGPVFL